MAEVLVDMDPCSLRPADYRKVMIEYIDAFESLQIHKLLEDHQQQQQQQHQRIHTQGYEEQVEKRSHTEHYAFHVNAVDLIASDSSLAFSVMNYPNLLLPLFNEAVVEAQLAALRVLTHSKEEVHSRPSGQIGKYSVKLKVNVRIHTLPPVSHFCRHSIGQIRYSCASRTFLSFVSMHNLLNIIDL